MLDRNSILPLYYQLAQILRIQIHSDLYKSGQKIPSERDLMDQFKISRNTVRQAVDILVQEGLLHRDHGYGTYVSNLETHFHYKLNNFIENNTLLKRAGYVPSVKTLSTELIFPDSKLCKMLEISSTDQVICFSKLFYANDRPAMYTQDFIAKSLAKSEFESSGGGEAYLAFLESITGIRVEHVLIDIVLREVDEDIAALFNCSPDTTVMVFEETFLDNTQRIPIAYSHNYFNREVLSFRLLTSCS